MTRTHVSRIESGQRETPFSNFEKWLDVCGYTLQAMPKGEGEPILNSRGPSTAQPTLPAEALYVFLGVIRAWPMMSERERRVVAGQMSLYAEEYQTAVKDVPADALYAFIGVMQAWPQMSERARRVVAGQIGMYAEVYGTAIVAPSDADED